MFRFPVASASRVHLWLAALSASLLIALTAFAPQAIAQQMNEGKEYQRLKNPVPVETGNKIEVIEFFSFGCPHCAHLEPILQGWLKNLPPDVQFRRVPVLFQPVWVSLAKVYYTLDALDANKLAPEVFAALHEQNKNLANEKTFFDWAATKGLDRKKVEDMYNSFGINSKMSRAKSLAAAYNVQSVPMVFVDGKFMTASDRVGGHEKLPAAINALVEKARAERKHS